MEQLLNDNIKHVRSLYAGSLKLLNEKAVDNNYNLEPEKYTNLRFELQKLGFASIYNLKNQEAEESKGDEAVKNYLDKRFSNLNDTIIAAYHFNNSKKGVVNEIRKYLNNISFS